MGQLANFVIERAQGSLPSNTKKNPKEQINAIHLRNGKELQGVKNGENQQDKKDEKNKERESKREPSKRSKVTVQPYQPKLPFP